MNRWEGKEFDADEKSAEEIRLLKKFHDYLNLEKNELERKKRSEDHSQLPRIQKNYRISIALLEGAILVGLTAAFVFLLSTQ